MIVLASLPMLAILTWLVALMIDPGQFEGWSVVLLGGGWIVMASITTVGLVLVGGQWALRTLLIATATGLYVGLFRPSDPLTVTATALTAAAMIALLSPQMSREVRKLPSASGPPPVAVMATLIPLSLPLLLGLIPVPANGWSVVVALGALVAAFLYSRTITGGLVAIRFGLPVLTIAFATPMGIPHGVVSLALVGAGTAVAWAPQVAAAFHPLIEKGSTYAIPPELAPPDILERARIDESGNRL